jgi:hypothetical protein
MKKLISLIALTILSMKYTHASCAKDYNELLDNYRKLGGLDGRVAILDILISKGYPFEDVRDDIAASIKESKPLADKAKNDFFKNCVKP